MEKANTPDPGKSLGYIKCYSSSSLRIIKGSSHSIRYKGKLMEKICSKLRIPKTILEIRKKTIYKLFEDHLQVFQRINLSQNEDKQCGSF